MIELLVAVTIFGLAMVPLMWMGGQQSRGVYSVGKHMMAGQVAASILDRILSNSYEECQNLRDEWSGKSDDSPGVLENKDFVSLMKTISDKDFKNDLYRSFKKVEYKVDFTENSDQDIMKIDVQVFYRIVDNNPKTVRTVLLSALKFRY